MVSLESSGWCAKDPDVGWIRAAGAGSDLAAAIEGYAEPCWELGPDEGDFPSVPDGKTALVFFPLEPGIGWTVEPASVSASGDEWTADVRIADHYRPGTAYDPVLRGRLFMLLVDAPCPETARLRLERDPRGDGGPTVEWW
jgi:hypothetical protein